MVKTAITDYSHFACVNSTSVRYHSCIHVPVPFIVDNDTTTSSAIVAPDGIVVIATHTIIVESLSAPISVVGIENSAAVHV